MYDVSFSEHPMFISCQHKRISPAQFFMYNLFILKQCLSSGIPLECVGGCLVTSTLYTLMSCPLFFHLLFDCCEELISF